MRLEHPKCPLVLVLLSVASCLVCLDGRAVTARADDSAQPPIPSTALVVIQIHGVSRTEERLAAMLQTVSPELASHMKAQIEDRLKVELKGRRLEGLAPAGPDFIVVMALSDSADGSAKVGYVARVTDYAAFEQGLLKPEERQSLKATPQGYQVATLEKGQPFYILHRGDYAFFTSEKKVLDQLQAGQPELKLSPKLAGEFLNRDVAVYWNLEAINKKYGNRLQSYRQRELQRFGPDSSLPWLKNQPKTTIAFFEAAINAVFDVIADGRAAVASADFQPKGLALRGRVDINHDTRTDRLFQSSGSVSTDQLSSLPAGQTLYGAMTLNREVLEKLESLTGIGRGTATSSREMQAAIDELIASQPRSVLAGVDFPLCTLKIYHVQNPEKAADAMDKMFQALDNKSTLGSAAIQGKPVVTLHSKTYRGFRLGSASMKWDFDKMLANYSVPAEKRETAEAAFRRLMGEGLQIWFGTNGQIDVQVAAQDWAGARRLLDRYLDGKQTLGEQPAFQQLRTKLPAEATLTALFDVERFLNRATSNKRTIEAAAGVPSAAPMKQPSFVALTARLHAGQGAVELWVPATAIQALHQAPAAKSHRAEGKTAKN